MDRKFVLGALAIAGVGIGVGTALGDSSPTTYTGCITTDGLLKVTTQPCNSGANGPAFTINSQGPAGPTGPQGAPGPAGQSGLPAFLPAYYPPVIVHTKSSVKLTSGARAKPVVTVTTTDDKSNHLLTGTVQATGKGAVTCKLTSSDASAPTLDSASESAAPAGASLALQGLNGDKTFAIACSASGGSVTVTHASLSLLYVFA